MRSSALSGDVERNNGSSGDRNDPGAARDWYRISFGESKDSESWSKGTTTCVVTAEMGEGQLRGNGLVLRIGRSSQRTVAYILGEGENVSKVVKVVFSITPGSVV